MDTSYRIESHSANYFAKIIQFVVFFQQSPENYLINLGTVTLDDVCHFYLKYNTHPIWALFIPFIRLSNGLLLFFFNLWIFLNYTLAVTTVIVVLLFLWIISFYLPSSNKKPG